jgi:NADH-quinone oxidoreductase subunit G
MSALVRDDGAAVLGAAQSIATQADAGLLILHTAAARVGAMDVGATCEGGIAQALAAEVIYNLGADEVDIPAGPFVIYQGSHGDRGAHRADVILPAAAHPEEPGVFVNTEGRAQLALRAGFAPGDAKENWAILRALSAQLGAPQRWDTHAQLRAAMVAAHPVLGAIDTVAENDAGALTALPACGDVLDAAFAPVIADFYLTNPIARASSLMADLSARAAARHCTPMAAQ